MSMYPSLEDMKVDNMVRAQAAMYTAAVTAPHSGDLSNAELYPSLGNYMGLELSNDVIALNMPEYQMQLYNPGVNLGSVGQTVAPLSSMSQSLQKATVTQAIRQVILCKGQNGKVGVRLREINGGLFVCYVADGSPAALGGLRFGDQILEINGVTVAGMSMDKGHELLQKAPVNGISLAVRDRPFERTVTLHKDSLGHIGFQFKDGKITAIVKDSSAAKNGLLTEQQLVEIDTRNVVGLKDKEISQIIAEAPQVVNVTIIPHYIYKHMIKKMATFLLRESMDRTPAV